LVASNWLRYPVCWCAAIFLAMAGFFFLVPLLLSDFDIHLHGVHLAIAVCGWLTVGLCFVSAYLLIVKPAYPNLWSLAACAVLCGLDYWLSSFPEAANLIH
jgi:hypothetical protein